MIHPCSGDCRTLYLTAMEEDTVKKLKNLKSL